MVVTSEHTGCRAKPDDIAKRIRINPAFAAKVYDSLAPGATVIVTDRSLVRGTTRNISILPN